MQKIVTDRLRPAGQTDPHGVEEAQARCCRPPRHDRAGHGDADLGDGRRLQHGRLRRRAGAVLRQHGDAVRRRLTRTPRRISTACMERPSFARVRRRRPSPTSSSSRRSRRPPECSHVRKEASNATAQHRFPRRMARRAQGASQEREGAHPHARPRERRAARAALGQGREELRLRHAGRQEDARRPVRREQPADHPPFHVALGPRIRAARAARSRPTTPKARSCISSITT